MKIRLLLTLSIVAILTLTLLSFTGCDGDGDGVYELQMATFWPAEDAQVAEGHQAWIDEIEERTDGQVQITLQAGEALLGADEIYEGVADGVADIGTTCPSYTPGFFPVTEAFELPGYNNDNALVASLTMQEGYERLKEEGLMDEYDDSKVLMFWATGPGDIKTTDPVESLDDLSGMEIRSAGGTVATLRALGAEPTGMPMSEAYESLDSGVVDGILGPTDTLKGFRLAEVLDYITKTPYLYNVSFIKTMNLDTWESLPPDIQEVFEEVNEEFVYEYGKLMTDLTRAGQEYGIEEGMEKIELSSEEEEKFLDSIDGVVEEWIEEKEDEGLPAREIVDIIEELDEKYSEEYGDY
ncbi:TRAP transporter substrate-binding protein [Natranaerofaba carboxydovora]|uniref:TRAP transporter substrate-binding protein n=1 Tax=Natranaerofaba carboxydovora TaxID=2742683 RepID=UPI001F13FB27|nr:TRAP transporter substrate-binding protein [Natranaerofaba carboxydovora]UMZ74347.1 Solute-binding protein [Natranaerofaba carboxydovora]